MGFARKKAWINGGSKIRGDNNMGGNLRKYGFIALTAVFLILSGFNFRANADTLYLKNGRSIEGLIRKEDADNVDLEIGFGSMKFSRDQIERIERSSPDGVKLIKQKWEEKRLREQARDREIEEGKEPEPKQVNMDKQSGHVMVETLLNNKVKANLILDTGSSFILLSSNIANNLGINANPSGGAIVEMVLADGRRIQAKRIILESVSVQGSEVKRVEAAILFQNESGAVPGDGLLGMSFLKNFNFKIDQKNNKLILEKL